MYEITIYVGRVLFLFVFKSSLVKLHEFVCFDL